MAKISFWLGALGAFLMLSYVLFAAAVGRKEALATLLGPVIRKPVDFRTLKLKDSPNQYLVCPPGYCACQPHAEAPTFEMTAEELRERWLERIGALPRVHVFRADSRVEQYDCEALSRVMGFPDTVTVRFIDIGEGRSTLALYSRSHYGHSDLGANRKRIEEWLRRIAG